MFPTLVLVHICLVCGGDGVTMVHAVQTGDLSPLTLR